MFTHACYREGRVKEDIGIAKAMNVIVAASIHGINKHDWNPCTALSPAECRSNAVSSTLYTCIYYIVWDGK